MPLSLVLMRLSVLFVTLASACLAAPLTGQANRWCDQPPRGGYDVLERVRVRDPWFHVYRVDPGVFALYEPYNFQEVISWLIVGTERALLFDTGMGMSRISAVVRELTRLPVVVVNSHTHYDHVGGNAEFTDIRGMDTWYSRESAAGIPHREVTQEVTPQAFCAARLRVPFDTTTYAIRPFTLTSTVRDGTVIPLGGRHLEVLEIPGHTPDAIALLDRAAGLLWTGDTFYPGPIWLFFPGTDHSAYAQSVSRLAALVPTLRKVLPAHNVPVVDPAVLARVPDAYARARAGQLTGAEKPDGLIEYPADGFSFLMRRPEPPLRVLFIGNSYTYFNNLPEIVADFARLANTSREVRVEAIVRGGATLRDHWDAGAALQRLRATSWDYVVLQEQSMLGLALQDGRPTINEPGFFHHYARLFVDQVKAAGATPVFFLTWSRRATPESQSRLTSAYAEIARATGARLAAVGPAWQSLRQQRPDLELYAPDGSHPSPTGSYLAAASIWSTISGATPLGLPRRARGRLVVDSATGSRFSDTSGVLVQLPDSDAAFIQRTIAATVMPVSPTPAAAPPMGSPTARAALPQLTGEWRGRMALYDDSVDVTLQLADSGGRLVGQWTVQGAGWSSTTRLTQPGIDGQALVFLVADPRFLAPTERHRAVWADGALHGTVSAGASEAPPFLRGSWRLRRTSP